jgi:hypothetical protein
MEYKEYNFPNDHEVGGTNFGQAVFIGKILIELCKILIDIKEEIYELRISSH